MRAQNELASALLEKLKTKGFTAKPGYFAGKTYCVGVDVDTVLDAFRLGSELGDNFGQIEVFSYPGGSRKVLTFRDAKVSA